MSEFVTVTTTDQLLPGNREVYDLDGMWIAVFNVDGRYYAVEDRCSHDDGPLAEGELSGTVIACPRHGATFNITNGAVLSFPATQPIKRFATRIVGSEVQIEVD